MTKVIEYPELSSAAPVVLIESSLYEGEQILDCKEVNLSRPHQNKEKEQLADLLKAGWKLVTIAWVRNEHNNFGHEPAVDHVLKAVIVQTKSAANSSPQ